MKTEFQYERESTLGGGAPGFESNNTYLKRETSATSFYAKYEPGRLNYQRPHNTADLMTSAAPPQYQCIGGK